jgi:hypothetical protein
MMRDLIDRARRLVETTHARIAKALAALPQEKRPAAAIASHTDLTAALNALAQAGQPAHALTIRITANGRNCPEGKEAEADLQFAQPAALRGLRLIGFGIWTRRTGQGLNVTFPARSYQVNGERRSFALLRPTGHDAQASDRVRDLVLDAWHRHQETATAADVTSWTRHPPARR